MTPEIIAAYRARAHDRHMEHTPGQCYVLSRGDKCHCGLCDTDALLAEIERLKAVEANLRTSCDNLKAIHAEEIEGLQQAIEDQDDAHGLVEQAAKDTIQRLTAERDAALARVAELEAVIESRKPKTFTRPPVVYDPD